MIGSLAVVATIVDGPRVDFGCSAVLTPSMITKSAHVCVGCTLVSNFANECRCACPAYQNSPN